MLRKSKSESSGKNFSETKIGIISAEFNKDITLKMLNACQDRLFDFGLRQKDVDVFWVPGAFEIPLKAKQLAEKGKYQALITFGAIIKGDTYHFELVANECARGVMDIMLSQNIPIIFEVLACYNKKDALKRAGDDEYNKGLSAAEAVLKVLNLS